MQAAGEVHRVNAQFIQCLGIPDQDIGEYQGDFYLVLQSFFLRFGQGWAQVGNNAVVAGEYPMPGGHLFKAAAFHVSHGDTGISLFHAHDRGV